MNKIILTLFASFAISLVSFSQAPEGVNYQMVVRNFTNTLVTNSPMAIRVQIRQTSATGTIVYSERHPVTTSVQGLVNLVIGSGTVLSGTFSTIQWANGPYFACFAIDFTGLAGTNYQDYGSQQLMSVPYALYAKSAGATLNQWQYGTGVPAGTSGVTGNYYYNTSNGNIYYKQNGTTWILVGNIMGPTGVQGLQGATGAQGPQGIQGSTGSVGSTGNTGANGLNGPQGATGPSGTNGINGTNGFNTLVATTTVTAGAQCTTGGVKLEYGLDINNNGLLDASEITSSLTKYVCNGLVGTTGPNGQQGPIGLTGPSGPQGLQGIQGLAGANGPAGATGPAGTNGTAVLNGTTAPSSTFGSNGDFYINTTTNTLYGPKVGGTWPSGISLVGPTGTTGPQGIQGLTGASGPAGPAGPAGLTGPTGPIGLTGPQGPSGSSTLPTYTIGYWPELGGYVFRISSDGKHGLVCETIDQGTSEATFAQNLISDPSTHSTAGAKFMDWRVPTLIELNEMYSQRIAIGNFQTLWYWSSVAQSGSSNYYWYQNFGNVIVIGPINQGYGQYNICSVRSVRSF